MKWTTFQFTIIEACMLPSKLLRLECCNSFSLVCLNGIFNFKEQCIQLLISRRLLSLFFSRRKQTPTTTILMLSSSYHRKGARMEDLGGRVAYDMKLEKSAVLIWGHSGTALEGFVDLVNKEMEEYLLDLSRISSYQNTDPEPCLVIYISAVDSRTDRAGERLPDS